MFDRVDLHVMHPDGMMERVVVLHQEADFFGLVAREIALQKRRGCVVRGVSTEQHALIPPMLMPGRLPVGALR